MAAKTNLPSPKSRSHQDPSNRSPLPPVMMTIAADSGDAVCTIDAFGSLKGIPHARLSGGAHVDPLYPLAASMSGLGVIRLEYAEDVANGDLITWPDKDPAIRNRPGGYVEPMAFTVSGTAPVGPLMLSVELNSDAPFANITFDQDMAPAGPSIAGIIYITDADGVRWKTQDINDVTGPVVQATLVYADSDITPGTSISSGIGAVLVGLVGGLPAEDWPETPFTQVPPTGPPFVIHSTQTITGQTTMFWNAAVTDLAGTFNTIRSDAANDWNNVNPTAQLDAWTTQADCGNNIGVAASTFVLQVGSPMVNGAISGLPNANVSGIPCPLI